MTLKATIGVSIVAFGICLAVSDASAAAFQPASSGDANWIRYDDTVYGGVYNTETQISRYVVAPGRILLASTSGYAVTITGVGNWSPITCTLQAYGLTTGVFSSASSTYQDAGFFTMTVTLPGSALGPNPSGWYSYGTVCTMPPVNAQGKRAEIFWLTPTVNNEEIQAAGWVPANPNDSQWIRAAGGTSMFNNDSGNAHFASAAIPARQLAAGNHTITFHGQRSSSSVTYVCQLNLRNQTTGEAFGGSVTSTAAPNTNFTMAATVNVTTAGMYDVGLLCKLPPVAYLYGARDFH